jgi:hypothetical protein
MIGMICSSTDCGTWVRRESSSARIGSSRSAIAKTSTARVA